MNLIRQWQVMMLVCELCSCSFFNFVSKQRFFLSDHASSKKRLSHMSFSFLLTYIFLIAKVMIAAVARGVTRLDVVAAGRWRHMYINAHR